MVIDGRIKLKNDSLLQGFTKNGLKFEDGSEIEGVDVVIFATGLVTYDSDQLVNNLKDSQIPTYP